MIEEDQPFPIQKVIIVLSSIGVCCLVIFLFISFAIKTSKTITDTRSKASELVPTKSLTQFKAIVNTETTQSPYNTEWSNAYSPTTIKQDKVENMFFCSSIQNLDKIHVLNYIRYTSSSNNAQNWTTPSTKLIMFSHISNDPSTCHISIIKYNNYYYLYVGTTWEQTVGNDQKKYTNGIAVSRAESLISTFYTYTDRGTWEANPPDPKNIISSNYQLENCNDMSCKNKVFGTTQPNVVVTNNELKMWYKDTTPSTTTIYTITTNDPSNWSNQTQRVYLASDRFGSIKYDTKTKRFINVYIQNLKDFTPEVEITTSLDGITWNDSTIIIPNTLLPDTAFTFNISSDISGNIASNIPLFYSFAHLSDKTKNVSQIYGEYISLPLE